MEYSCIYDLIGLFFGLLDSAPLAADRGNFLFPWRLSTQCGAPDLPGNWTIYRSQKLELEMCPYIPVHLVRAGRWVRQVIFPRRSDDDDDDGDGATFQRHVKYVPALKALARNLAPHVRHTPTVSTYKLPSISAIFSSFAELKPRGRFSNPAEAPKYRITVSSNIGSHWDVITLRKPDLQQDNVLPSLWSRIRATSIC